MRLPISNRLRNLNKQSSLERCKKIHTYTNSTRLPATPRKDNHPAGIRRKTVQVERSISRNPNGFITAPLSNRSS